MNLVALNCTRCGAVIPENNLAEPVVSCDYCGCTFVLSGSVQQEKRSLVPIPPNMSIVIQEGKFTLTYRWKSTMGIVLIIFGCFFFFFSLFWTSIAFYGGGLFGLFGVSFILFSVFLIYMGIAYTVNQTIISIRDQHLAIYFKPLWWPGAKNMNVKEIAQLFVQRKEYQNKGNATYFYHVVALLKGNRSLPLVKMIQEPEIARCIEQQIERFLGIKDVPIPGESKL